MEGKGGAYLEDELRDLEWESRVQSCELVALPSEMRLPQYKCLVLYVLCGARGATRPCYIAYSPYI